MKFDLDDFLPYQLARTASHVSREFANLYSERFGISVPQWRVIAHLAQSDAVSVRDIHIRVGLEKPRVSRAAASLVKSGHVRKIVNPKDKRLVELSLTTKGRALFDEMIPIAQTYESELLEKLGPTNKKLLTSLLANLTEPEQ